MDSHGFSSIYIHFHGFTLIQKDLNGFSFVFVDSDGFSWICMDLGGIVVIVGFGCRIRFVGLWREAVAPIYYHPRSLEVAGWQDGV